MLDAGNKPRLLQLQADIHRLEHGIAEFGQSRSVASALSRFCAGSSVISSWQKRCSHRCRSRSAAGRWRCPQFEPNIDKTFGGFARQRLFPGVVAVTADGNAHFRPSSIAIGLLGKHAPDIRRPFADASTVLVSAGPALLRFFSCNSGHHHWPLFKRLQLKTSSAPVASPAQANADKRRRIKGADIFAAVVGKIFGVTAVETLVRIRCKQDSLWPLAAG